MYLEFGCKQNNKASSEVQMAVTDQFDRLPSSLVMVIFYVFGDIKALGRCLAVSKHFNGLVPEVEDVVVKVDCVISGKESGSLSDRSRGFIGLFGKLVISSIVKPLQALQQILDTKKVVLAEVSHHSPGDVLKNFKEIQNLRIELPGGELGVEDGVLLRWRAKFGSTLERCVVLGSTSYFCEYNLRKNPRSAIRTMDESNESLDDNGGIPESFYTDDGLKLRVFWTISS